MPIPSQVQRRAPAAVSADVPESESDTNRTARRAAWQRDLDAATKALSHRYAMDFRKAAERYAALGRPEQVAAKIRDFYEAGARHIVLDIVGPYEERPRQIAWFAKDVLPLLSDLRGGMA